MPINEPEVDWKSLVTLYRGLRNTPKTIESVSDNARSLHRKNHSSFRIRPVTAEDFDGKPLLLGRQRLTLRDIEELMRKS